jgi:hypothetical protein
MLLQMRHPRPFLTLCCIRAGVGSATAALVAATLLLLLLLLIQGTPGSSRVLALHRSRQAPYDSLAAALHANKVQKKS